MVHQFAFVAQAQTISIDSSSFMEVTGENGNRVEVSYLVPPESEP